MNEVFLPHAAIEFSDKWRLHGIESTYSLWAKFILIQQTLMEESYQVDLMRDEQDKLKNEKHPSE